MEVKIDTKEKFHVIIPQDAILSANMTEEFKEMLLPYLNKDIKNIIVKLEMVKEIDKSFAEEVLNLQQVFNDNNVSFVVCELQKSVEQVFEKLGFLEILNATPTESEAWDIVQMEEIEREFLE